MVKLPPAYTACEEFKGYTIAVLHGWYKIFNKAGGIYLESRYTTRANARRGIELLDGYSHFTDALVAQD